MLKIKRLRTADCVVGGFRYKSGRKLVGSLLLGLYDKKDFSTMSASPPPSPTVKSQPSPGVWKSSSRRRLHRRVRRGA